jgi:hypothetical protein
MRWAGRGNAPNATITHAEERSRRLICAGRVPNLRYAKLAKSAILISARANRSTQQTAVDFRFGFAIPVDVCDVTLGLKAIVGAARTPLIHKLYEVTTAAG